VNLRIDDFFAVLCMIEFKTVALTLSFFVPFSWAAAILLSAMMKSTPKRHLFFLLLASSFMYLMTYAKFQGHTAFYAHLFPIQAFLTPVVFPLFYLYVYTLTSEKIKYNWKYYIHFVLPVIWFMLIFIPFKIIMSNEEEVYFMKNLLDSVSLTEPKYALAFYVYSYGKLYFMLSSLFYLVLVYLRYRSHIKYIRNVFSTDKNNELTWIMTVSYLFLLTVVFNLIIQYMRNKEIMHNDMMIALSFFVFSLFFWFLGLYGYQQKEIYNPIEVLEVETFSKELKVNKQDIINYLEKEKPYLKPDISIFDFCLVFKTNRTYLSEAINKMFNMNFRTLINTYRVAEAKKMLQKAQTANEKISLENIAVQAGFNNYNSFLRVFKTLENTSPSSYMKMS
jgi:AraC-like DNA-binding protein